MLHKTTKLEDHLISAVLQYLLHTYIYIYVCVCVCVCARARARVYIYYFSSGYRKQSPFGRDKTLVTFIIFISVHYNKSLYMHSISTYSSSSCLPPVHKVEKKLNIFVTFQITRLCLRSMFRGLLIS